MFYFVKAVKSNFYCKLENFQLIIVQTHKPHLFSCSMPVLLVVDADADDSKTYCTSIQFRCTRLIASTFAHSMNLWAITLLRHDVNEITSNCMALEIDRLSYCFWIEHTLAFKWFISVFNWSKMRFSYWHFPKVWVCKSARAIRVNPSM